VGMIGHRGNRFKVKSLQSSARKETAGEDFNAEFAEGAENAEPESEREGHDGLTAETLRTQRSDRREEWAELERGTGIGGSGEDPFGKLRVDILRRMSSAIGCHGRSVFIR